MIYPSEESETRNLHARVLGQCLIHSARLVLHQTTYMNIPHVCIRIITVTTCLDKCMSP